MYVGWDNGTGTSQVATVDPATGKAVSVLGPRGDYTTKSVLFYPRNGPPLIGQDAEEQGQLEPDRVIRGFKLKQGTTDSLLANKVVTPTDATETYLSQLKTFCEKNQGETIEGGVFAHPANFKNHQLQAFKEAIERTGMEVIGLRPEPTLVGIGYLVHKAERDMRTIIYDLGHGTFDISILDVAGEQVNVMSTAGIATHGGWHLTLIIRDYVLSEAESRLGSLPTDDPLFTLDVLQRCEAAKIALNTQSQVPIVISYDGHREVITITQAEYHRLITPFVEKTLDAVDEAVAAAGLDFSRIDKCILAGGTSRDPFIQDRVAEHTKLRPNCEIDPDRAVSYGAALACVAELKTQGRTASLGGKAIPDPRVKLREATRHDIGARVIDKNGVMPQYKNSVVVPKNSPLPCTHQQTFSLEHEQQTAVDLIILEGDDDADEQDCRKIGDLLLDDLPVDAERTGRVQVEYAIDRDGLIAVTVTDKVSGKTATASVDYKDGIN